MKKYKQFVTGFIVIITVLGLLAFYFPGRDFGSENSALDEQPQNSSNDDNLNYDDYEKANLNAATSSASVKETKTETEIPPEKITGFDDLNQENELLKNLGAGTSSTDIEKMLKEFEE